MAGLRNNIFLDPLLYREIVVFRLRRYLGLTLEELGRMTDREVKRMYRMLAIEEGKKWL
jgi:hypothetical protein